MVSESAETTVPAAASRTKTNASPILTRALTILTVDTTAQPLAGYYFGHTTKFPLEFLSRRSGVKSLPCRGNRGLIRTWGT